ncbi:hypothetical protein D1872_301200 [compost metagenome]
MHLWTGQVLDIAITVMNLDVIWLIDLVNDHGTQFTLNFSGHVGVRNLGMQNDRIHFRIQHVNASLSIYPGAKHNSDRLDGMRFAK